MIWTRRDFLSWTSLAVLEATGAALALSGDPQDVMPDGSAARGMITKEAEAAIERGLSYLSLHRARDGSFGTNAHRGNVAITSLAALAFMAGGHQPGRGAYGFVVADGLKHVLSQANHSNGKPAGYLYNPEGTPHGPMYGHGFGTLFLAEVTGMVHQPALRARLRDVLHKAVQVILQSQNSEGGWRYQPIQHDADISVTICQIMALRAAKNAGVYVPKSVVDRCVAYVKRCQNLEDGSFRYQANGSRMFNQPFVRTAAGVCALYSAGIYKGPEVEAGLRCLLQYRRQDHLGGRTDMHYFYGHYYAVQAMWTAGGAYWSEWFPSIREELLNRQRPDGSWLDPIGAHYGTAMACIILQVPNNYLPILQK